MAVNLLCHGPKIFAGGRRDGSLALEKLRYQILASCLLALKVANASSFWIKLRQFQDDFPTISKILQICFKITSKLIQYFLPTDILTYIRTYLHTYLPTYVLTFIRIYSPTHLLSLALLSSNLFSNFSCGLKLKKI